MGTIGEAHIKVTPKVLNDKAEAVSRSINAMERCFDELAGIISRTSYYWIGEAGDQHRKIYSDQKDSIAEMMKRLKEHPADLQVISQNYTSAEQAVREVASNLPGDIIE